VRAFKRLNSRQKSRTFKLLLVPIVKHQVIKNQVPYQDLGQDYFDTIHSKHLVRHHLKRLESLGFEVSLKSLTEAAREKCKR